MNVQIKRITRGICVFVALPVIFAFPMAFGSAGTSDFMNGKNIFYACHAPAKTPKHICDVVRSQMEKELQFRQWVPQEPTSDKYANIVVEIDDIQKNWLKGHLLWRAQTDQALQRGQDIKTSVIDTNTIPETAIRSFVKSLFKINSDKLSETF